MNWFSSSTKLFSCLKVINAIHRPIIRNSFGYYHWILRPFYIETFNNAPYVVMPFCKTNFRELINTSGFTSKNEIIQILSIILEICKGLIYANQKGLVAHQDLKPENILLTDNSNDSQKTGHAVMWEARISDFGWGGVFSIYQKKAGFSTRLLRVPEPGGIRTSGMCR